MTTVFVTDVRFDQHTLEGHPEHAVRLQAVRDRLEQQSLLERMQALDARPAIDADLSAVHTQRYLQRLAKAAGRAVMFGADTYSLPDSFEIARLAAGAVLQVVDAVVSGAAANGIAAIRPPGHHATPGAAMGFCLLNNAAIAARYAQRAHGLERVAIVDYDVHHGNGTQDIFYEDGTVLYVSTHQSPLYPGTGALRETGRGLGAGTTVNIPLPPRVGDAGYEQVFTAVVGPVLRRFEPELILVSAGFDAHWVDPLANMRLSLAGYDWMTRFLIDLAAEVAARRVIFVMEGGYDLVALSSGWANVAYALLGDAELFDPLGSVGAGAEPAVDHIIERSRQLHSLS